VVEFHKQGSNASGSIEPEISRTSWEIQAMQERPRNVDLISYCLYTSKIKFVSGYIQL
jgi:hypothetical protein